MNLTLEKGLKVLECLAERAEPMVLGDIVKEVGGNKSTVYRMLETLKSRGYIEQEEKRGMYRAGLKVLELSSEILNRMELRKIAGPYLHELAKRTSCDVYLSAGRNGKAVIISDYHPGGRKQSDIGTIGSMNSFYFTASGKLLAAFLPEEEVELLIKETTLEQRTPSTITDISRLRKEFAIIRDTGVGYSRYENSREVFALAVPVRNYKGSVIAALGIAVPRKREEKKGFESFEHELIEIGKQLSFALGFGAAELV